MHFTAKISLSEPLSNGMGISPYPNIRSRFSNGLENSNDGMDARVIYNQTLMLKQASFQDHIEYFCIALASNLCQVMPCSPHASDKCASQEQMRHLVCQVRQGGVSNKGVCVQAHSMQNKIQ